MGQCLVILVASRKGTVIQNDRLDSGGSSTVKTFGRLAIRKDHPNRRPQALLRDSIDERLKVTAPTRNEDAERAIHIRFR